MSQVITKRSRISRRRLLKGLTLSGTQRRGSACRRWYRCSIRTGTAYAAEASAGKPVEAPIESRFVFWFNGNGIPGTLLDSRGDRRGLSS